VQQYFACRCNYRSQTLPYLHLLLCAGNTEKCSQDDNFIYCYCCYYSLLGAVCPCYIAIPKNVKN
jgi:hypothetical protein